MLWRLLSDRHVIALEGWLSHLVVSRLLDYRRDDGYEYLEPVQHQSFTAYWVARNPKQTGKHKVLVCP